MLISGVVSDSKGRKLPLIWNLTLDFTAKIALILLFIYSKSSDLGRKFSQHIFDYFIYNVTQSSGVLFLYVPSVIYGISGGAFNFFLLSFSYLGDLVNTAKEEEDGKGNNTRLVRFTTTETSITVGTVLGYFVANLISRYYTDREIFIFNAVCLGLAALYCAIRVNNITIMVSTYIYCPNGQMTSLSKYRMHTI